jgi:Cu/Ag efflux protein CusF
MNQLITAPILAFALVVGNAAFAQSVGASSAPTVKAAAAAKRHQTTATVRKADEANGTVILAHGPVDSLNWPPMTMAFKVRDKTLFKKLEQGKKVAVEFTTEGSDYVVVGVK